MRGGDERAHWRGGTSRREGEEGGGGGEWESTFGRGEGGEGRVGEHI